jgi:hypothetical protein
MDSKSIKRPDLEGIKQRLAKATPGPWVDLTNEWNETQERYYKQHRVHYHGALKGTRNRHSAKNCAALIVSVPRINFSKQAHAPEETLTHIKEAWERLDLYPDWYDFGNATIIGTADDEYKWGGGIRNIQQLVEGHPKDKENPDRALIANAPTDLSELLAYVAHLENLLGLSPSEISNADPD